MEDDLRIQNLEFSVKDHPPHNQTRETPEIQLLSSTLFQAPIAGFTTWFIPSLGWPTQPLNPNVLT